MSQAILLSGSQHYGTFGKMKKNPFRGEKTLTPESVAHACPKSIRLDGSAPKKFHPLYYPESEIDQQLLLARGGRGLGSMTKAMRATVEGSHEEIGPRPAASP